MIPGGHQIGRSRYFAQRDTVRSAGSLLIERSVPAHDFPHHRKSIVARDIGKHLDRIYNPVIVCCRCATTAFTDQPSTITNPNQGGGALGSEGRGDPKLTLGVGSCSQIARHGCDKGLNV